MSSILWIAGLVAGILALAQLARYSLRLREELDELRARVPEPAPAATSRSGGPQLFGGLYEEKAGPFDGVVSWPGVPLACAAAGLFAIGLATGRAGSRGTVAQDSTVAIEMAAARMRHDSLARSVSELRDSVAALEKSSAAPASAPARAASRGRGKQPATTAVAQKQAALPPMPKLGP